MDKNTIIVSLTTHSIRLQQVAKTAIFSIIKNTYKNIHICLTLYKDDIKNIPEDLKFLIDEQFVELIVADKDLGPHLKYFYAMKKYKENPIITVDDDIHEVYDMTLEDFDNLFKVHGFEKKTIGGFDWVKKVYQRYGKGYLKAVVGKDFCKIVYFRFDPTLHYDDEKCYELHDSYKVSFDTEDAIPLLRDYIMDYDQE